MGKYRFLLPAVLLSVALVLAACAGIGECQDVAQPVTSGPGFYDGDDEYATTQKGALRLDGMACSGNIAEVTDADNWTFEGKTDQTIQISVQAEGEADPQLTVIDPNGDPIDTDDDSGGGTSPLLTTTLPQDGVYTFRIDAFAEGAYKISVKTGSLEEDEPVQP